MNETQKRNLELHIENEDLRKDNIEMLKALKVYRDYVRSLKRAKK